MRGGDNMKPCSQIAFKRVRQHLGKSCVQYSATTTLSCRTTNLPGASRALYRCSQATRATILTRLRDPTMFERRAARYRGDAASRSWAGRPEQLIWRHISSCLATVPGYQAPQYVSASRRCHGLVFEKKVIEQPRDEPGDRVSTMGNRQFVSGELLSRPL